MADLSLVDASGSDLASFIIQAEGVSIGNNKSMISLLNASGSTVVIKIRELRLVNDQVTAITGVISEFTWYRFTGHSSGTSLTPETLDTQDSLNSSVTARTGATITGESTSLMKMEFSSDEWGPGTSDTESTDHAMQLLTPIYKNDLTSAIKPLTIRAGEGVHIKHLTNSTNGKFDILLAFTQE